MNTSRVYARYLYLLISTIITPRETPLSSLTFQKSHLTCRAIVSHLFLRDTYNNPEKRSQQMNIQVKKKGCRSLVKGGQVIGLASLLMCAATQNIYAGEEVSGGTLYEI